MKNAYYIYYLSYILVGSLVGLFVLQPINDMVIYHLYEAKTSALTSWQFIFDNLLSSLTGQKWRRAVYYIVVGGLIGTGASFLSTIIMKKLNKINSLNEELSKDIELIISQGEGSNIEFKSSFRWDIKEQRANKILEAVVLKTIAGFLNSDGGSLLIGVTDDGVVLGLDADYTLLKRGDRDGFEQAIITIVASHLGTDLCQFIHVIFHAIDNKEMCRIIIKPSSRPVYLTQKGSPQLFLRTGGGTRDLNIKEAAEYIKGQWG